MTRTAGSMPMGSPVTPPAGKYNCVVTGIDKGKSKNKGTPYIELQLSSGEYDFSDQVYVTEKTLTRLTLVARRVCGMPDNFEIPDSDKDAVNVMAKYIVDNARGKACVVKVEEIEETFMPSSGPDAGRKITKKKRRVAYNGYDRATPAASDMTQTTNTEELPF